MNTRSTHPAGRAFPFLAALVLGALLALGPSPVVALADTSETGANRPESIAILHTNDIHAHGLQATDATIGFGGVAGAKKAAQDAYGPENVVLVDAGDAILGSVAGALTRGEDIVTLMKAAGYDLAVPGNHDFDYGLARLKELNELAQEPLGSDATTTVASTFRYLASNVTRRDNGETLFPAYEIRHFGDIDVAFVGVVRPETPLTENPGIFEENGEIAWSFHGDDLAVRVQGAVDAAIAEGADYVIAVTHLGQGASASLIGDVKRVDAVIDAHSHSIVSDQTVRNGDGERIPIAQCGSRFQAYGAMIITPSDSPSSRDIASSVTHASPSTRAAALPEVNELVAQVEERVSGTEVGTTEVALTVNAQGGETNLGNFVADAYRFVVLGAEVGLVNAGGIEALSIATGDTIPAGTTLTMGVLVDINPYGNDIYKLEMSGATLQKILVRASQASGKQFLQVSGVQMRGRGSALSVRVLDVATGAYRPLDPSATYTVATSSFLANGGDGYTMFDEATVVDTDFCTDYEALCAWLTDGLDGVIDERYASTEGRIDFTPAPSGGSGSGNPSGNPDGSGGGSSSGNPDGGSSSGNPSGGSSSGNPSGSGGGSSSGNPDGGSGGGSAAGDAGDSDDGPGGSTGGSDGSGEDAEAPASPIDTFRLYNRWTGEHLYTQSVDERTSLQAAGWTDEGTAWTSPAKSDAPVHRLFNEWSGEHFYTSSGVERDVLSEGGWTYEGVAFYSDPARGSAVFRLYNPYATSFTHHYTTSPEERDGLLESGWRLEGEAWYGA